MMTIFTCKHIECVILSKLTASVFIFTLLLLACNAAVVLANRNLGNSNIAATVKALRQIKVAADDVSSVPVEIQPLLTQLKHQLRDLAAAAVNKNAAPKSIRNAMLAELKRQGIAVGATEMKAADQEATHLYGDIDQITVRTPSAHRQLIAVTVTISIPCGTDTSFYLFQKKKRLWELIMAQEANGYEMINDAQGGFGYAVSPPSGTGDFFVVTKSITPWCSSNWQGIRYQIMRPGSSAYAPQKMLKREESIFLGGGDDGIIVISPVGFRIEFEAGQKLDGGIMTRRHISAYHVRGDRTERIPPFGTSPEDFLDEWFDLPWEEAAKWIMSSAQSAALRKLHAQIQTNRTGKDSLFFTSFADDPPSRRVKRNQWQIGIEFESSGDKPLPADLQNEVRIDIIKKGNCHFMKGISSWLHQ